MWFMWVSVMLTVPVLVAPGRFFICQDSVEVSKIRGKLRPVFVFGARLIRFVLRGIIRITEPA